jgi:hypothetical protein
MARITRDSSVLNQFGSPSINSNTLANRPTFGQPGRLFVSTDTLAIYRDTGSAWTNLTGGGSTPNLEAVTTIGNTSTKGIFLGLTGSLTNGLQFEVSGYSRFSQVVGSANNLGSNVNQYFELQTSGTTIAFGAPSPSYSQLTVNMLTAQTIGGAGNCQIGAGLFENVITDNGSSVNPLTITQTSGLSALSPLISYSRYTGLGGATINKYAGFVINGIQATGGSALTIIDNYQLLINSSQQFSGSTTVTNRWGVYQAGANDINYFAGKVLIGTTTSNSSIFNVNGDTTLTGNVTVSASGLLKVRNINTYSNNLYIINSGFSTIMTIFDNGKINIGTSETATTRLLTVQGEQEWSNITFGTGTHTTSGNHFPIWVNGVKYWLALLNPPI